MTAQNLKSGSGAETSKAGWVTSYSLAILGMAAGLGFAFLSSDDCTTVTVKSADGLQTSTETCS